MSSPIISVYLGPLRSKWDQHCLSQGVKSSSALKQVIQHLLSREFSSTQVMATDSVADGKTKRIEIRLKPSLYAELQRRSKAEGFSPNRLIVGILDLHISKNQSPLFGQYHLDMLTSSNRELLKIGSNLNQVARAINRNPLETDLARLELIQEVRQEINLHTQHVAALIEANLKRWSVK